MKEIEIVNEPTDLFDTDLGYYKIVTDGSDDVVLIKNLKKKKLTISKSLILSDCNDYKIEEVINTNSYVVKPLDTLTKIATTLNTDEEKLVKLNNLKTNKLFIGQIIKY